jgi:hypothetical protein
MKLREASVNPQLNHDKGGGEDGSVRIADGEFRDWNVGEKKRNRQTATLPHYGDSLEHSKRIKNIKKSYVGNKKGWMS